ncbi:acyl-CoA dehydrogenase family protein [Rhizobium rhizogenes]|uniref:acyl-CoA dehydrogenase family protein n=1 Tax=Rhizobium rhizogenes TaxID=359 RepID=UPI001573CB37|nr:acyl-CoA dehydrogenase family protein [Rhizobium rhizogenes]NTI78444.1 acyl-CoA/acyl-ACP dehydrogenase [Rhizobium rhizogenes]
MASEFEQWVSSAAHGLNDGSMAADDVLPRLVEAGHVSAGVPASMGGAGGDITDAVAAVATVARSSLAAAFMLWGHRAYVEYLLQSPNRPLLERDLSKLLSGEVAGATGLSNAMKFLAGMEALQIRARSIDGGRLALDGKMPWVTNLKPARFHVAAAVERADGGPAFVASLAHDDRNLTRLPDLDLMAMRSTDTAAIILEDVAIGPDRILADNAVEWLPQVRPAFLGLQCGMSIGLARRSLSEAGSAAGAGRAVLTAPLADLCRRLDRAEGLLLRGLRDRSFELKAPPLFEIRIELAEIVAEAVALELEALGGRAYLREPGRDYARRLQESAFIPVITPSLVQLKSALEKLRYAA